MTTDVLTAEERELQAKMTTALRRWLQLLPEPPSIAEAWEEAWRRAVNYRRYDLDELTEAEGEIKELKDEVSELKADLEDALAKLRRLQPLPVGEGVPR